MNNVTVRTGDLFKSEAQTLTNTVNTVGVMGKGIALEFKRRFPQMFEDYLRRCERGEVALGKPYLFKETMFEQWVLNFPTKKGWRTRSSLSAIQDGLAYLREHIHEWGITSLAVPPLGCGYGGLEWGVVGPALYRGLARLDIPVELYAPYGTPHEELQTDFLGSAMGEEEEPGSKMSAAGVALAAILQEITSQKYHYPIGRTSMRKIAYFATRAGIPTGLEFDEWRSWEPQAEGLRSLLTNLANHSLIQERENGRMFVMEPGPTLADAQLAFKDELAGWKDKIERVADLFLRVPNTKWAELFAAVQYHTDLLANQHQARNQGPVLEQEVEKTVKPRLHINKISASTSDDIKVATRTLSFLRWIDVPPVEDEWFDVDLIEEDVAFG